MWEQVAFWGVYFSGFLSVCFVGLEVERGQIPGDEKIVFLAATFAAAVFWPLAAPAFAGWSLWKELKG